MEILSLSLEEISQYFKQACLDELSALKPGNVHLFADGHGMVVDDFVKSAEASSLAIMQAEQKLGKRIYNAVEATWHAVECNTNLGIILLSAPIVHACLNGVGMNAQQAIANVLSQTDIEDCTWVYKTILRANPAGLGKVEQGDVAEQAEVNLLQAMELAAHRDMIAMQYVNGYQTIFDEGIPLLAQGLTQWERSAWATTLVYLAYLARYQDSHIARKYGQEVAERVRQEASIHFNQFVALSNPKTYMPTLLAFDKQLKEKKINPGTSADLTVATLFLSKMLRET